MKSLISLFSRYKKTNFKAGGVFLDESSFSAPRINVPDNFCAPNKIDFRDMCLPTSDQAQTPHCTGYALAGYIEVQNWRKHHYPEQIDGDNIYVETKKIDGRPNMAGSWVDYAAQAAINLNLISGKIEVVKPNRMAYKFAIHEFGVVASAFMITDDWNKVKSDGIIVNSNTRNEIGGHAVICCGFDKKGVYIQNSWGIGWGLYGFALLSWEQFDQQFKTGVVIRP